MAGEQRTDVALEDEVGLHRAFDRLGPLAMARHGDAGVHACWSVRSCGCFRERLCVDGWWLASGGGTRCAFGEGPCVQSWNTTNVRIRNADAGTTSTNDNSGETRSTNAIATSNPRYGTTDVARSTRLRPSRGFA
jgi:hypothetical protein